MGGCGRKVTKRFSLGCAGESNEGSGWLVGLGGGGMHARKLK